MRYAINFSYAKAFQLAGVKRGDIVCMLMGRSNTDVFFAAFGAWVVGAVLFFGDVRAGAKALANQVNIIQRMQCIVRNKHVDASAAIIFYNEKTYRKLT
jgi:hypothetical protein